jgi:RNA polymerase sigma factor for flagellar operon FliA
VRELSGPQDPIVDARTLERAHAALWVQLERCPTDIEVADALAISVDRLHAAYRTLAVEAPEVILELSELCDAGGDARLLQALLHLPERERSLLVSVHRERRSLAEIAAALGVSAERISPLHSKALVQLRVARTLVAG